MKKIVSVLLFMFTLMSYGFIPVENSRHLDKIFKNGYEMYSPLNGYIHIKNNFINNLYKYGDDNDLGVKLIRKFFTELPGGEITFSHKGNNPAAHFTPEIIGKILLTLESSIKKKSNNENFKKVHTDIKNMILNSYEYLDSIVITKNNIMEGEKEFENFVKLFENSLILRKTADQFHAKEIVPLNRQIKKLRKEIKKGSNKSSEEVENVTNTINDIEKKLEQLKEKHRGLSLGILTGAKMKEAKKKYKYIQDANNTDSDEYYANLDELIDMIIESYIKYDLRVDNNSYLPFHSTKNILLAYLWQKMEKKENMKSFYEAVNEKFIDPAKIKKYNKDKIWKSKYSDGKVKILRRNFALKGPYFSTSRWIFEKFSDVVVLLVNNPVKRKYAPLDLFSYMKWYTYSDFPDCGENAIRNFFNQLLFNPVTNKYDYTILERIKQEEPYTNLNQKLIDYYKRNENPYRASNQEAREWIVVVSKLNEPSEKNTKEGIFYRKEGTQRNLASPYSNMKKVINRLIGVKDLSEDHIADFVSRVSQDTGANFSYDDSGIDKKGFGKAIIRDDDVKFVITSNKPVHFDFSQVVSSKDKAAHKDSNKILTVAKKRYRKDYGIKKYQSFLITSLLCNNKKCYTDEQFYQLLPAHYPFFYLNLDSAESREESLKWISNLQKKVKSEKIRSYLNNMSEKLSNS